MEVCSFFRIRHYEGRHSLASTVNLTVRHFPDQKSSRGLSIHEHYIYRVLEPRRPSEIFALYISISSFEPTDVATGWLVMARRQAINSGKVETHPGDTASLMARPFGFGYERTSIDDSLFLLRRNM